MPAEGTNTNDQAPEFVVTRADGSQQRLGANQSGTPGTNDSLVGLVVAGFLVWFIVKLWNKLGSGNHRCCGGCNCG